MTSPEAVSPLVVIEVALLRPVADAAAQERVRELVLQAYAECEEGATTSAS